MQQTYSPTRRHTLLKCGLLFVALLTAAPLSAQRNAIKATLLSLGSGSTRISYEHAFTKRSAAEATVGIIGWGLDVMNHAQPRGLLLKAAYKLRLAHPDVRGGSPLEGLYLKPEVQFASFSHTPLYSGHNRTCYNTTRAALLAEVGYQLVWDWFVFDIYFGLGPSVGDHSPDNYYHSFMLMPDPEGWLAFTSGFRIGVDF